MARDNLSEKQLEAVKYIRNCIAHGQSPSVRDLQKVLGYGSPRSAALIIDTLIDKKIVRRRPDRGLQLIKDVGGTEDNARTVEVPLVGTVACGTPILAEENIEANISVSEDLVKEGNRYFLLRATGDSMDQAGIHDGDIILVKQQATAINGEKVVALIDNEATVKEFHQQDGFIILKPKSSNPIHQPIILKENFVIQGVVVEALSNLK
jgi:repressor LexA